MALTDPGLLNQSDDSLGRFLKIPGVTSIAENGAYIGKKAADGVTLNIVEVMNNMQLPYLLDRFWEIPFTLADLEITLTPVYDAKYRLTGEPGTVKLSTSYSAVNAIGPYDGCIVTIYTEESGMSVEYGSTTISVPAGVPLMYMAKVQNGTVEWIPFYRTNHAVASDTTPYGLGTGSNYGHVNLTDDTDDVSDSNAGTAATPKAVNEVKTMTRPVTTGGTGLTTITNECVIVGQGTSAMRVTGVTIDANNYLYATNVQSPSRRELKQDIEEFKLDPVKLIESVDIVQFRYKADVKNKKDSLRVGFIADDTDALLSDKHTSMDTGNCIGVLLAAVKQLSARVKELESKYGIQ